MQQLNETHDPSLRSWVDSANDPAGDFPIQNLPFVVFDRGSGGEPGVLIGDRVLALRPAAEAGAVPGKGCFSGSTLNGFAAAGREVWSGVRASVSRMLRHGSEARASSQAWLIPAKDVQFRVPMAIGDYTDFYASIDHATTVGSMFRPDNPLLPNYRHVPIGYHGRASSIVVSGTSIRRPCGQQSPPDSDPGAGPKFGPCTMLDYELEMGVYVGVGCELGETIPISRAREHMFGMCIVNDWSARDIQKWEYQPLGPFLAKNFATSVSAAVVSMEALAPYAAAARPRAAGEPAPLPYLTDAKDQAWGGLDLSLEVLLRSAAMRERGDAAAMISRGSFASMYWTIGQMLAHHASNGCNMCPGDLLASGTISGKDPRSRGCLLELTWDGVDPGTGKPRPRKPVTLPGGETRAFLADGDEVIIRAYAEREGRPRIGFGECRGIVLPARG